jgi:hypothetical protein
MQWQRSMTSTKSGRKIKIEKKNLKIIFYKIGILTITNLFI